MLGLGLGLGFVLGMTLKCIRSLVLTLNNVPPWWSSDFTTFGAMLLVWHTKPYRVRCSSLVNGVCAPMRMLTSSSATPDGVLADVFLRVLRNVSSCEFVCEF